MQKEASKQNEVLLMRLQGAQRFSWRSLMGMVIILITLLASGTLLASAQGTSAGSGLVTGNYCFACHLAEDTRLQAVTAWQGGVDRNAINPCPDAVRITEELYYTERLLLMMERGVASLPRSVVTNNRLPERIEGAAQSYLRLLDTSFSEPTAPASLDAFVSEAQVARYRLGKINTTIHNLIEQQKEQRVLLFAGLVTLVVIISLLWGMRHTGFEWPIGRWLRQPRAGFLIGAIGVLLVLALFALPLFRVFPAEVAAATEIEQEQAAKLDEAQRAASTADRIQARAATLARIGAAWGALDPQQSEQALTAMDETLNEGRKLAEALWGRALAAEEAAVGFTPALEKARLTAVNLEAARQWPWGVAQAAMALAQSDPERARALLESAPTPGQEQRGIYADLQRRMLALAWQGLDEEQAQQYANLIGDAMIRSWTWRELAQRAGSPPEALAAARQAAREIADPLQRARSLQELAKLTGEANDFALAEQSLRAAGEDLPAETMAFAWADLAVESGRADLLEQIPAEVAAARAFGHLGLGQFEAAWQAALEIVDPYEQAQAQAAIAVAAGSAELATQIKVTMYRDLALRDLIRQDRQNAALLDQMTLSYPRLQALTALGRYPEAWQAFKDGTLKLSETYPLVELAIRWGQADPAAAAEVSEAITREFDRAQVLLALSAQSAPLDQAQLERALGLTLAARVRGDATAPARLSLLLAQQILQAPQCQMESLAVCQQQARSALEQALSAALKIMMK